MSTIDIFEILCEGDAQADGLRFAGDLSLAQANHLHYLTADGSNVDVSVSEGKIMRQIDAEPAQAIPLYAPETLDISGVGGESFQYYDKYGNITAEASEVKLVGFTFLIEFGPVNQTAKSAVAIRTR